MKKTASLFVAALAIAFLSWAQNQTPQNQPPTSSSEYKIPPEDAAKPNPVKPTSESLAKGKKMYVIDCAMCHGEKGDGKGDMASDIKNVTDFTNPDSLKDRTDGELFYIIKTGKGAMPPEGPRVKTEELWNLVNYVRAFAKK